MRFHQSLFLVLLGIAPAVAAQSVTAPRVAEEAGQALADFHRALQRGDSETALALLMPDASIFESGVAETREQYRSHHLAGDIAFARATRSQVLQQEVACAEALCVVTRQTETRGSFKGKDVNLAGTETAMLRQVDQVWKIAHLHWSSKRR